MLLVIAISIDATEEGTHSFHFHGECMFYVLINLCNLHICMLLWSCITVWLGLPDTTDSVVVRFSIWGKWLWRWKLSVFGSRVFCQVQFMSPHPCHRPLTKYAKFRVTRAPGMPATFSQPPTSKEQLVSDPGMHHGTCMTHVPWCMSGSLTCGGRKNVPGIPVAYTTRNFTYLVWWLWLCWVVVVVVVMVAAEGESCLQTIFLRQPSPPPRLLGVE